MSNKHLWAPWRLAYLAGARSKKKPHGCLFCERGKSKSDLRNQVVARGRFAFSMLNRFPYNNGHLLVAPYRHISRLDRLTEEEWSDIHRLATDSLRRLDQVLSPDGYNLGINLGRSAGAGIPGHLHLHLVPRWTGDTNFMPVLSDSKVISQSLESAHRLLRAAAPNPKSRRRRG